MQLRKSACMKILALLYVYLILAGVVSSVHAVFMFVYLVYKIDLLTAAVIGVPLVLILIGITSILPIAEYAYIRQGYTNPAIARDSQRAYEEWKREKRQTGLMILISAIIVLIFNPWSILVRALLPSSLNNTLAPAFINAVVTILNAAIYRKWLQKHVDLSHAFKRLSAEL